MNCDILQQDIQTLLEYFQKNMYKAKECENGTLVCMNNSLSPYNF